MEIWREFGMTAKALRENAPNILVRGLCTFVSVIACAGVCFLAIWTYANALGTRVRDVDVGLALLIFGVVWLGTIWILWRPFQACRPLVTPILTTFAAPAIVFLILIPVEMIRSTRAHFSVVAGLTAPIAGILVLSTWGSFLSKSGTSRLARPGIFRTAFRSIVIIGVAIGLSFIVDEFAPRRESEFAIAAVLLVAASLVLLGWIPYIANVNRRKVVDDSGLVNVHCPSCAYSLIGLRELRCPECGSEFVLDELIRAQNYDLPAADPPVASSPIREKLNPDELIAGSPESP